MLFVCPLSSLDVVLQGQRAEVESMITDMGVGQSAVQQLSIYCISLKKLGPPSVSPQQIELYHRFYRYFQ